MNIFSSTISDSKSAFVLNGIKSTEKNMDKLELVMTGYLRNQERIRKKSLKMSQIMKTYADSEPEQLGSIFHDFSQMLHGE
jgi:pyridoxal/pyridoxine/pyridoxamine kinase